MSGFHEKQRLESAQSANLPIGTEKECFKCKKIKPIEDFYRHPQMKDGRLNKCKECTKRDVSQNYIENVDYYKKYEKKRSKQKHRIELNTIITRRWRKEHPERWAAQIKLNNAVRDGKIKKEPCCVCGVTENIHGHHYDYSKPLSVIWLCPQCHNDRHKTKIFLDREEKKGGGK